MKTKCPQCKKYFTESYIDRLCGLDRCFIGISEQEKKQQIKKYSKVMFCNNCGWEWTK